MPGLARKIREARPHAKPGDIFTAAACEAFRHASRAALQGASGALRAGNPAPSTITAKGFDTDCSFMMVEIAGNDLFFQTVSRTGVEVDSGVIRRTIRPAPGGAERR